MVRTWGAMAINLRRRPMWMRWPNVVCVLILPGPMRRCVRPQERRSGRASMEPALAANICEAWFRLRRARRRSRSCYASRAITAPAMARKIITFPSRMRCGTYLHTVPTGISAPQENPFSPISITPKVTKAGYTTAKAMRFMNQNRFACQPTILTFRWCVRSGRVTTTVSPGWTAPQVNGSGKSPMRVCRTTRSFFTLLTMGPVWHGTNAGPTTRACGSRSWSISRRSGNTSRPKAMTVGRGQTA